MQRTHMVWVLAAGLGVAVASCDGGGGGTTEPTTGTVSGSVTAAGTGVPGATLTLTRQQASRTATSAATGAYAFASVEAGTWALAITPPAGFELAAGQAASVQVTVSGGETETVNFGLTEEAGSEVVLITLAGTSFSDADVTIDAGTTIRWRNEDNALHTVTPDGHSAWSSVTLDAQGETFEHTFNTPGTYNYYCNPHRSQGMTGVIRVQ